MNWIPKLRVLFASAATAIMATTSNASPIVVLEHGAFVMGYRNTDFFFRTADDIQLKWIKGTKFGGASSNDELLGVVEPTSPTLINFASAAVGGAGTGIAPTGVIRILFEESFAVGTEFDIKFSYHTDDGIEFKDPGIFFIIPDPDPNPQVDLIVGPVMTPVPLPASILFLTFGVLALGAPAAAKRFKVL